MLKALLIFTTIIHGNEVSKEEKDRFSVNCISSSNSFDLSYSDSKMREGAPGLPTLCWHGDVLTVERFLPFIVAKFSVNRAAKLAVSICKNICAFR